MVLRHRPGAGGESAGEDGKTEAVRFVRAARIKCSESSFVETGKEQFMQSALKMQKSVWFHTLLEITLMEGVILLLNCLVRLVMRAAGFLIPTPLIHQGIKPEHNPRFLPVSFFPF